MQYFDFYYAPIFGDEWKKIRLALLTGQKYTALLNNYADLPKNTEELKKLGALDLFEHLIKLKSNDTNNDTLGFQHIPKALKVFCFDNGNIEYFPEPTRDENKKLSIFFTHSIYIYYK